LLPVQRKMQAELVEQDLGGQAEPEGAAWNQIRFFERPTWEEVGSDVSVRIRPRGSAAAASGGAEVDCSVATVLNPL